MIRKLWQNQTILHILTQNTLYLNTVQLVNWLAYMTTSVHRYDCRLHKGERDRRGKGGRGSEVERGKGRGERAYKGKSGRGGT